MCIICNDWKNEKMTSDQLVSNLFEIKEEIGRKHIAEIVNMLCGIKYGNRFALCSHGEFDSYNQLKMWKEVLDFCQVKRNS